MENIAILAIFVGFQLIFLAAGLIFGRIWVNRRLGELKERVTSFFSPPVAGQSSEFAGIVGVIGDDFAGRIVAHAKSTFMGLQSGQARQEKAITGAISQDLITMENPMAGAILQSFPAVRKLVNRNPELAAMLPGIIERFTKGGGGGAVAAGSNGNGSKFGKF